MKEDLSHMIRDFFAMIYPRNCAGCGRSLAKGEDLLCTICKFEMPRTGFEHNKQNTFNLKFYGRLNVEFALAYLHFHKEGVTQHILHNLKYRNQPEIGEKLGEWFGTDLLKSGYAGTWDIIIPIPLHPSKEKKRGYNQSNYFAAGLGKSLEIPCSMVSVVRKKKSETQTHKSRAERWKNVEGIFFVKKSGDVMGKHVLLVDDVVTTGSTLESCGQAILEAGASKLSVATLAIAH